MFRRWIHRVERCPRCGLPLEREEGAFLGALAINWAVTGVAFCVLVGVWLAASLPDVEVLPLTLTALGVAIVVPVLAYPFSKTIWAALDLVLHRIDPEDRRRPPPA